MKEVSKEEFLQFLRNYPRELTYHVTTICDPLFCGYYDFSLSRKHEEALVASFLKDARKDFQRSDFDFKIKEN